MRHYFKVILFLQAFLLITVILYGQPNNSFSFKIDKVSETSAGVFLKDGTLLKTLWSGVRYDAGTNKGYWDGTDDTGRLVPNGIYTIKVLSSDIRYKWDGVIGNTSDKMSGPTVHHALMHMYGMVINNNYAYYATGYNEQNSSTFKFSTDTIQRKETILTKGLSVLFVTSDGINIYWGGVDVMNKNSWFVFATNCSSDLETGFLYGKQISTKYGKTYSSAIAAVNEVNGDISGLAVQKKGALLFVAHKKLNKLDIIDKSTGLLVNTVAFDSPGFLNVDGEDNLWILCKSNGKPVAEKFEATPSGTLKSLNLKISNLADPLALATSPGNSTLVIADGGSSQQLKAFNNKNGVSSWTFGLAGGYADDPNVADNKFYFGDLKGDLGTFIAFQPDGSFWVEDTGNDRVLHYSANREFINEIMYLPLSYSSRIDSNNPARLFSDYLEFKLDYTKPLAANNGSWSLVRNWGYNIPSEFDDKYNRLSDVTTLSNGHTYALLTHNGPAKPMWRLAELPQKGPLRLTEIEFPKDNSQLYPDGSIRKVSGFIPGKPTVFTIKPLIKFNDDINPVWGPESVLASTPPATASDPSYRGNSATLKSGTSTSSGVIVIFDGSLNNGWHLGGIRAGDNKWLWRTAKSTYQTYTGLFPPNGYYDTGNNVLNAGSTVMTLGRSIFWGYHGERWKNGQVNKWNQVYDDGLFIGQFGIAGPDTLGNEASPEMAGNSFSASITTDFSGNHYLFHNDESYHGGIHRWEISGLETIKEESIPFKLDNSVNGILFKYFNGPNLNNMDVYKSGLATENTIIEATPDMSVSSKMSDTCSVMWKGFIAPPSTGKYFFSIKNEHQNFINARLWVDHQLVMDYTSADGLTNQLSGTELIEGKRYSIKFEAYLHNHIKNITNYLSWRSESQPIGLIPAKQFFIPIHIKTDTVNTDLTENLPFNSTLENNRYGWNRNPALDDSTDRYKKWWSIHTNIKTTNDVSPDVFASFQQQNGYAFLTRSLGVNSNLNSWTFSGNINFAINCVNVAARPDLKGKGGVYFELLDENRKLIVRIFLYAQNYTSDIKLYANDKIIYQANKTSLKHLEDKMELITVKLLNGQLLVSYGLNQSCLIQKSDATANIRSPEFARLSFYSKNNNSGCTVDLKNFTFLNK